MLQSEALRRRLGGGIGVDVSAWVGSGLVDIQQILPCKEYRLGSDVDDTPNANASRCDEHIAGSIDMSGTERFPAGGSRNAGRVQHRTSALGSTGDSF